MFNHKLAFMLTAFAMFLSNSDVYPVTTTLLGKQYETTTIVDNGRTIQYFPRLLSICSVPYADTAKIKKVIKESGGTVIDFYTSWLHDYHYLVELDSLHDSYTVAPQISLSAESSEIRYAAYQLPITAGGTPVDSLFHLQRDLEQSQDHDIDAPDAWDYASGSNSIRLAALDYRFFLCKMHYSALHY